MSVSYKPFSELAAANTLIAADIIPVVTTTGGNNSKKITYETFAQTVSSTLIGPFTTTITAVEPASAGRWNSTYTTVRSNSASWGAPSNGLTIFKQISSVDAPNGSTTVHALSIISDQSNVDIAILSKGTGATLAQIPNTSATGGAKRGQYATDWQKQRVGTSQVASGGYSVIGGGNSNRSSGTYSTVGGGWSNDASGEISTVGGGNSNQASGEWSTIGGGNDNATTGVSSTVAGGDSNTSDGDYSTIGGGLNNDIVTGATNSTIGGGYYNNIDATANDSTIGGGYRNRVSGDNSTIGGGVENEASGRYSTIGGGTSLTASGNYSTAGGGEQNQSLSSYSTIGGGYRNIALGEYSTIGGGNDNDALASNSTVAGGSFNIASGEYSTIGGGYSNQASGKYSTVIGGYYGRATLPGQLVYSTNYFTQPGDAQMSTFLLTRTTTSAVSSVCYLDNLNNEITMSSNQTMFVTATVACLSSQENGVGYFGIIKGVARCNNAGNVSIYSQTVVDATRFPTTLTTANAGLSAAGNKLRIVVFIPGVQTFRWNVKLEALSINGILG
jgi:hypothetical protein